MYAKKIGISNNLSKIKLGLDQHFVSNKPLKNLIPLFQKHLHIKTVNSLLLELLSNNNNLKRVANRSYWHGNGFLKIVLLDFHYKLRLHIWFPNNPCEENIHSHRWGFISQILIGTLNSELWQDLPHNSCKKYSQKEVFHLKEYQYTAKQANQKATKKFIGFIDCIKTKDVAQDTGEIYIMKPTQLHKINHNSKEIVATIVCTEPTNNLHNRLIPSVEQPQLNSKFLSSKELRMAIILFFLHQSIN